MAPQAVRYLVTGEGVRDNNWLLLSDSPEYPPPSNYQTIPVPASPLNGILPLVRLFPVETPLPTAPAPSSSAQPAPAPPSTPARARGSHSDAAAAAANTSPIQVAGPVASANPVHPRNPLRFRGSSSSQMIARPVPVRKPSITSPVAAKPPSHGTTPAQTTSPHPSPAVGQSVPSNQNPVAVKPAVVKQETPRVSPASSIAENVTKSAPPPSLHTAPQLTFAKTESPPEAHSAPSASVAKSPVPVTGPPPPQSVQSSAPRKVIPATDHGSPTTKPKQLSPQSQTPSLDKKKKVNTKSRLSSSLNTEMSKGRNEALNAVMKGLNVSKKRTTNTLPPLQKAVASQALKPVDGAHVTAPEKNPKVVGNSVSRESTPSKLGRPGVQIGTTSNTIPSPVTVKDELQNITSISNSAASGRGDITKDKTTTPEPGNKVKQVKSSPLSSEQPEKAITSGSKPMSLGVDNGIEVVRVVHAKPSKTSGANVSVKESASDSKVVAVSGKDATPTAAAANPSSSQPTYSTDKVSQRNLTSCSSTAHGSSVTKPVANKRKVLSAKVEPKNISTVVETDEAVTTNEQPVQGASVSHGTKPAAELNMASPAKPLVNTPQESDKVATSKALAAKRDPSRATEDVQGPSKTTAVRGFSAKREPETLGQGDGISPSKKLQPAAPKAVVNKVAIKPEPKPEAARKSVLSTKKTQNADAKGPIQGSTNTAGQRVQASQKQSSQGKDISNEPESNAGGPEFSAQSRHLSQTQGKMQSEEDPFNEVQEWVLLAMKAVNLYRSHHNVADERPGTDSKQNLASRIRNHLAATVTSTGRDGGGTAASAAPNEVSVAIVEPDAPLTRLGSNSNSAVPADNKAIAKGISKLQQPPPLVDQRPDSEPGQPTSAKRDSPKRAEPVERSLRERLSSVTLEEVYSINSMWLAWSREFSNGRRSFEAMAADFTRIDIICQALSSPWPDTLTISDRDIIKYIRAYDDTSRPIAFFTKLFDESISTLRNGKNTPDSAERAKNELKEIMSSIRSFFYWIQYLTDRITSMYNTAMSCKDEKLLKTLRDSLQNIVNRAQRGSTNDSAIVSLKVLKKAIMETEEDESLPYQKGRKKLRDVVRLPISELGKISRTFNLTVTSPTAKSKNAAASSSLADSLKQQAKSGNGGERAPPENKLSSANDSGGRDGIVIVDKSGTHTVEKMYGKDRASSPRAIVRKDSKEQAVRRTNMAIKAGGMSGDKRGTGQRASIERNMASPPSKPTAGTLDITIPRRRISSNDQTIDVDKVSGSGVKKSAETTAQKIQRISSENAKHVRKILASSPSLVRSGSDGGRSSWNAGHRRNRGILRPAPTAQEANMEPVLKKRRSVRFASQVVKGVRASELDSDEVKSLFHDGYDLLGNGKDLQSRAVEERCASLSRGSVIAFFGFLKSFVSGMKDEMEGRQVGMTDSVELPYPPSAQKAIARMVHRSGMPAAAVENGHERHARLSTNPPSIHFSPAQQNNNNVYSCLTSMQSNSHSRVQVRLLSCHNLPSVNLVKGRSDPYAVIKNARTKQLFTTVVCLNTINPKWYETFLFTNLQPTDKLTVTISDKNLVSDDVPLGCFEIDISASVKRCETILYQNDIFPRDSSSYPNSRTFKAQPDPYQPSAPPASAFDAQPSYYPDVHTHTQPQPKPHLPPSTNPQAPLPVQHILSESFTVNPGVTAYAIVAPSWLTDLSYSAPAVFCRRFQSHKFTQHVGEIGKIPFQSRLGAHVGRVLKSTAQVAKPIHPALDLFQPIQAVFQEYSSFKINIHDVDTVFRGKRQSWNRDHPPAQKIFSQRTSGVVSRTAIHMQHAYLYGGVAGVKPLYDVRKDLMEVSGSLLGANDFLEAFQFGLREGKPRMFTYVLMPKRLYMAETGAQFFRDIMSKHAMHSSASTEVVYAGELHIRCAHGQYVLVVDNNSGTYAPDKDDLPSVAEVFRRNFPGLDVIALDYRDPLLEQYRNELVPCVPNDDHFH